MPQPSEYEICFTARQQAELLPAEIDPAPLKPDWVQGRTLATLVSPGTEINGGYLGDRFPCRPGYAAVFQVEAVGEAVTAVHVGQHVFTMGRHASFQRAPAESVVPVPAGLAPVKAVFARLMGVGMATLTTTRARPPAKVLVTGLGPVGHLAAQVFAASGYTVMAVDPIASRRQAAADKGLHPVWDRVPVDEPAVRGQVDLVLECSGHEQAALDGCRVVRKGGEVVLIATPWRRLSDVSAHDLMHAVFYHYVHLRSGWEWEVPLHPVDFRPGSLFDNFRLALRWLSTGQVRVDGLYRLAHPGDCQEVYQDLLHRRGEHIVAVFDWTTLKDSPHDRSCHDLA